MHHIFLTVSDDGMPEKLSFSVVQGK